MKHRINTKRGLFSRLPKPALLKHGAVGAMGAQVSQASASFTLQVIAIITLGFAGFGKFAILYGSSFFSPASPAGSSETR